MMNLNLSNILSRTNKGLDVYQYILNQYYKNEKLVMNEKISYPVRDPFHFNQKNLIIELRDQIAGHWDLEKRERRGDMLDFAIQHFKPNSRRELYYMINQALELGLVAKEFELGRSSDRDPAWNPRFSLFQAPIRNTIPCETLNLAQLSNKLDGGEFREITLQLRAIQDPKLARTFKATHFPYVTFAGTFDRRNDKELVEASELMVFDFDDLQDLDVAKYLLLEDDYFDTELMFTSPSGNGLKWVIRHRPSATIDRAQFFLAVSSYLKSKYGLIADKSGSDLSRACFIGYDSRIFLNARHWNAWVEESLEAMNAEFENERKNLREKKSNKEIPNSK